MPRKVIIDCDPGIDDALALALALFDPRLEVVAVTAVAGNVPADRVTSNAQAIIERLDPPRAHLGRAQLARAVEVALLTGTPLSVWHAQAPGAPRRSARYLLVDPGPALRSRIDARLHEMLRTGWEREVAALDSKISEDAPAWNASGYRAVRDLVRGAASREDAIARAFVDTRQYAKRQRTWFRHQLPASSVTTIDPTVPNAIDVARRWLEREGK